MTEQEILGYLREVHHPAKDDRDLIDLRMIDTVSVQDGKVEVVLAFPKRPDPLKEYLIGSARAALVRNCPEGTQISVNSVVKEPAATKKPNVNELGMDNINNVRHIIGIASGKGGVGKSTVAVNLAIALSRLGFRVGLADADVYGPSVPMMTDTEEAVPLIDAECGKPQGQEDILPIEKYGVKWMSIGYFAKPGQALIWRGPMACNALKQMILQVKWEELDYLLIDMPPGTGDIHISLVHDIPMEGAVIVTTPQNVALADVEKGIDMFKNKNINKTVYGIVENMSWFTPAELPENKYYIFGRGGGERMAEKFGVPLLGQIPIVESIREDGDAGVPAALFDRPDSEAFLALAARLAREAES